MRIFTRIIATLGLAAFAGPGLSARNYIDYHRRVNEAVELCIQEKYAAAGVLLEEQFRNYEPFADDYLLAAFVASKTGDTAARRKYLTLVHNSNIHPQPIRNKELRKALKALRLPPSAFNTDPVIDSIMKEDQRLRNSKGIKRSDEAHVSEGVVRAWARNRIAQNGLPSERSVPKIGPLSLYRILLSHFPAADIGWYDSSFIRLVDNGVLRPNTVALIMDYRGAGAAKDSLAGYNLYYGYMNDVVDVKLVSHPIEIIGKGLPPVEGHAAQLQPRRDRIGIPDRETNMKILKYLDDQGIGTR